MASKPKKKKVKKGQRDRSVTNQLKERAKPSAAARSKSPKGGKLNIFGKSSKQSKKSGKDNNLALTDVASGSSGFAYGDLVELTDGRLGTIRYMGSPVRSQSGVWLGISLAEPSGKNDGSQRGVRYWKDKPKHGMFTKPNKVKKIVKKKPGTRFTVNDIVRHSKKGKGIIRYIGELETRNGALTYGIELLEKIGRNNGYDKRGRFMFRCNMSRGMFVKGGDITLLSRAAKLDMLVVSQYDDDSDDNDEKDDDDDDEEEDETDIEDADDDDDDDPPHAVKLQQGVLSVGGTAHGMKGKKKKLRSATEQFDIPDAIDEKANYSSAAAQVEKEFDDAMVYIPPASGIEEDEVDILDREYVGPDQSSTPLVGSGDELAKNTPSPQPDNTETDVPPPAFTQSAVRMDPQIIKHDEMKEANEMATRKRNNTLGVQSSAQKKRKSKNRRGSAWIDATGKYAWLFEFAEQINGIKSELVETADGPFDVATSQQDFEYVCETIFTSCNNPTSLFKVLHGLTNRLLYSDEKYRIIDKHNIQLDNALLKYDGVVDFLKLLGFGEGSKENLLELAPDQPPLDVLDRARTVCMNYIKKCDEKREAINVIKRFKLLPGASTSMKASKSRGKEKTPDPQESKIDGDNNNNNNSNLDDIDENKDESTDDSDEDVTFKDEVDGETDRVQLADIVWTITDDNSLDSNNDVIKDVLLLTHRTWTTSMDLLNCVEDRFFGSYEEEDYGDQGYDDMNGNDGGGNVEGNYDDGFGGNGGGGGGAEDDYGEEEDGYNDIILSSFKVSTKCVDLLQQWMRTYWDDDFDQDEELIERLNEIISRAINGCKTAAKEQYFAESDPTLPAKQLKLIKNMKKTIEARKKDKGIQRTKTSKTTLDSKTNSTRNKKLDAMMDLSTQFSKLKTKFMNLDNKKIAQQITLMDFEIFRQIERRECLSQSWKKKNKEELSPNICLLIDQFNRVTKWVQLTILNVADNEKLRSKVIKKFIKVANELYEIRNFQSLCAVFGALNSTPIFNLKTAWSYVKSKHVARFQDLKSMFSALNNMSNLRKAHRESQPPMIPYSGLFLKDMVAVEEGNLKRKEDGTVNFARMLRLRELIDKTLLYQFTPYDQVEEDISIKGFILNEFEMNEKIDDDSIYVKAKAIRTAQLRKSDSKLRSTRKLKK